MTAVSDDVIAQSLDASTGAGSSTRPEATDAELLRAVALRNESAFEELRVRYGRAIERACRSIAPTDLEDCTQEVFARVWEKARLFDRSRGSAPAWLLTLARRTALNFHQARRRPLPIELPDGAQAVAPPEVDRFWLDAALERLPAQERRVIELAYFDDLTQSRIAAELGVPLGSVKSWARRGLNRLALLLDEEAE